MSVCCNCFNDIPENAERCPICGFNEKENADNFPNSLKAGTVLAGKYTVGRVLGQGGFGITYIAKELERNTLVAIKEFFPDTMSARGGSNMITPYSGQRGEDFLYGKEKFLDEAKTLARFNNNPNIVSIYNYFEENDTAYFTMEYVKGQSFRDYLKSRDSRISWEEAERILLPIMDALSAVHSAGIIHRDIKPSNIMITENGTAKLLDFGSARYSLGEKSRSLDVVLTHGFSPREQYSRHGRQGPYTDVYAMAATFYCAVTGRIPTDSIDRVEDDDLIMPSSLGVAVPSEKEDALEKALSVRPADRFQSMSAFREALTGARSAPAAVPLIDFTAAVPEFQVQPTVSPAPTDEQRPVYTKEPQLAPDELTVAMPRQSVPPAAVSEQNEVQSEKQQVKIAQKTGGKKKLIPIFAGVGAALLLTAGIIIGVSSAKSDIPTQEDTAEAAVTLPEKTETSTEDVTEETPAVSETKASTTEKTTVTTQAHTTAKTSETSVSTKASTSVAATKETARETTKATTKETAREFTKETTKKTAKETTKATEKITTAQIIPTVASNASETTEAVPTEEDTTAAPEPTEVTGQAYDLIVNYDTGIIYSGVYTGKWKNGEASGSGKFECANVRDTKGVYSYTYDGAWQNGERNGACVEIKVYSTGESIEGEGTYNNGTAVGKWNIIHTYADGSIENISAEVSGQRLLSANVHYITTDGSSYTFDGSYTDDVWKNGTLKKNSIDGSSADYSGIFKDYELYDGSYTLYDKNGAVTETGTVKNGVSASH